VGTTAIKEENTLVTHTDSVHSEGAVEATENSHQKEQKQTLQSLFSLLREEVEQMDSKTLPLCLHQVLPMILGCCFVIEDFFSVGKRCIESTYVSIHIWTVYFQVLLFNRGSRQICPL